MIFTRKAYTLKSAIGVLRNHIVVIVISIIAVLIYIAKVHPDILLGAIIPNAMVLVSIAIVGILFAQRKPAIACVMIFVGILAIVNTSYVMIFNPLDSNRYSREFSRRIATIVPASDKLIAYENVSNRFVQYFGRVVPEIDDDSALLKDYQNGNWIIATGDSLKKLEKSGKFKNVYYEQKAERSGQEDVPGALFHKTGSGYIKKNLNQTAHVYPSSDAAPST